MELKVTFKTITPIYTGDAWQQCEEIKPASIMGSLRFWFEVLCYFNGVIDNEYFDENGKPSETLDYKKFKELKDKIKSKMDLENAIDTILKDMEISLPSRIFGCTGWRGRIRIKSIEYNKNNFNKNNFKNEPRRAIIEGKRWYWKKTYYFGEFEIVFETDEVTKEAVLIPLLNFIERYGYLGGGQNIGYGRVKILNNNGNKDKTKFELCKFGSFNDFDFKDIVNDRVSTFEELIKKEKKILILRKDAGGDSFKDIIKELIKIKAQKRKEHKENDGNENERHQIFGYNNPTEGSKILPYVYEEKDDDRKLKGGFISIAGILNINGGRNDQ